jgi:hypothetical protein
MGRKEFAPKSKESKRVDTIGSRANVASNTSINTSIGILSILPETKSPPLYANSETHMKAVYFEYFCPSY